jgi:hypothetical protein
MVDTFAWQEIWKQYQYDKEGSDLFLINLSLIEGRITRTEEITWMCPLIIKLLLLRCSLPPVLCTMHCAEDLKLDTAYHEF